MTDDKRQRRLCVLYSDVVTVVRIGSPRPSEGEGLGVRGIPLW